MQVLSSLSSIPFYAPSAGFAPTNSADVSAIASAYAESAASSKLDKTAQVVTAIGTGWNSDDDEIVSAVNGCILSADEARYAGAADGSNYARYDRRPNAPGRRSISSLPGSAEVSAIASSYAASAASSKLDATASSQFLTAVPDGYATTEYVDSSISGFAYESAVSGWTAKQDALTFDYDDNKISAINGSALAAGSTYSAGEGIDITDDVISVETPVGIVAGPGIVIDNPDGNTLRVSTDEDYETVLFSGDLMVNSTANLSESWHNFDRIKVYGYVSPGGGMAAEARTVDLEAAIIDNTPCPDINLSTVASWSHRNNFNIIASVPVVFSANTTVTTLNGRLMGYWNDQWQVSFTETRIHVTKVVGVHRIANN